MALDDAVPRLLYLGDVPIESSYHGSMLIYRLLENYPKERLRIVEAGLASSRRDRQLSDVKYEFMGLPLRRLHHTRFMKWYATACLMAAAARCYRLWGRVAEFRPDAILTVTHGYSWITAACLARRAGVPLHLICHDEWTETTRALAVLDGWKRSVFGAHYRQAASRLCVSPFMAEKYQQLYNVPSAVLYPCRASDATQFAGPPERLGREAETFTCAFAGTINNGGVLTGLRILADALRCLGGRLVIFGPLDQTRTGVSAFTAANIELRGLVSSVDLMGELRATADALFVPMSFSADDRANAEISFPSKLTDYTAIGLPLLIYGPEYCSAVRWAKANEGVAEVVTAERGEELAVSLERLKSNPLRRLELAKRSLSAGNRYFSHEAAFRVFSGALESASSATGIK